MPTLTTDTEDQYGNLHYVSMGQDHKREDVKYLCNSSRVELNILDSYIPESQCDVLFFNPDQ